MPRARARNKDAVHFGALVTRFREARGWTLADLSRASGMNADYLGVLERGYNLPTLTTVFQLAAAFGVEAAELVREIDQLRRDGNASAAE